jgi:hypothetical protein
LYKLKGDNYSIGEDNCLVFDIIYYNVDIYI